MIDEDEPLLLFLCFTRLFSVNLGNFFIVHLLYETNDYKIDLGCQNLHLLFAFILGNCHVICKAEMQHSTTF